MNEDFENAKKGLPGKYSKQKLLSPFIGTDKYDLVNEQLSINEIVRDNSLQIQNSNYGEEDNILNNIEVAGEGIKYKAKAVKVLENLKAEKRKEIQKDSAGYYLKYNEDLQILEKEINTALEEDNFDKQKLLVNQRSALLDTIYEEKGIPKNLQKYITDIEATNIVNNFKATKNPETQIQNLEYLKTLYGSKMQDVFNHLVEKKMPPGALIMMSTNNPNLKNSIAMSFNINELETNIKGRGATKGDLDLVKSTIQAKLEEGYAEVVNAQPLGSTNQAAHINTITDGLYGAVLYDMFNDGSDTNEAVKKVVDQFEADYIFEETYWIPNDINGVSVNQEDKQSTMVADIKNNSVWHLNEKGDGLLLYVTRNGGSSIPIMDKEGNKMEILFLNNETQLPITNDDYEYSDLDFVPDARKGRG